jgi:hypothetical protein
MSDVVVDLFVEDRGHEELLGPIIKRVAAEEALRCNVRVRSNRGGHARAIAEYRLYQRLFERGALPGPGADLIVVGIDGNCTTYPRKREEIRSATSATLLGRLVVACPDPHVERWYMADPDSFHDIVGARPVVGRRKCVRDHYKHLLAKTVREAGHTPTLGGIEFAREIVEVLDWYRAGRGDRSFKAFVDELRAALHARRDGEGEAP